MPRVMFTLANVGVYSFSSTTVKPTAHYEFDLTEFRDPMNKDMFNGATDGRDVLVQNWVKDDHRFKALLAECELIAHDQKVNHGGRWLTLAFRDFHGRWKSPAVAELVADKLAEEGFNVSVYHDALGGPTKVT